MDENGGDCPRLCVDFPADPGELPGVRGQLRDWLSGLALDPARAYDLLLAAGEACTNSVEHGHRGDRRPVRVEALVHEGMVRVTVSDGGSWAEPAAPAGRPALRGHGVAMMRALVADFDLTVGAAGTTVALSVPLRTP